MPVLNRDQRHKIALILNGKPASGYAEPRMLLSDFLRQELGVTGTHVGCEHGVCGACTIHIDGVAVRSCLTLAVQAEGRRVDTVEGLVSGAGTLHPIQESFRRNHALQCGFCTPGILMSLADFLARDKNPDENKMREMLSGHLCRCTGYSPIVRGCMEAAAEMNASKLSREDGGV